MADHRFDDEILHLITGRDGDDPAMLWELLSSVDAAYQTFISPDDLYESLSRLAAVELIRELPGHQYVDATTGVGSRVMTPITLVEWEVAVAEFQQEFDRLNAEASEPYPRLRVASPTAAGGAPTDADMEHARDLRDTLTAALSLAGVTAMTGEVEADGVTVTFWVAGFDEPEPDRMEQVTRPVFVAAAPAGSTMEMDLWDALAETELPHDFWVIAPVGD